MSLSDNRFKSRYILWHVQLTNHVYRLNLCDIHICLYLVGGLNPSEKYESQLRWWHSQFMESHKSHVPNHQPDIYYTYPTNLMVIYFSIYLGMTIYIYIYIYYIHTIKVYQPISTGASLAFRGQRFSWKAVTPPAHRFFVFLGIHWHPFKDISYIYIIYIYSVYIYMYIYMGMGQNQ